VKILRSFSFESFYKLPGEYRQNIGSTYAIFAARGVVKIGSSTCPRARIREQISTGTLRLFDPSLIQHISHEVGVVYVSDRSKHYRAREKRLISALKEYRVGIYYEHFRVPHRIAKAIREIFRRNFSELAFLKLTLAETTV
jgi:hypothetical protein